jgi:ubiquinone biosynthesis protein
MRTDLFDAQTVAELQGLQDRVPPFPAAEAHAVIEKELGRPLAEVFPHFDDTPFAAASIAQVHHARLPDGGNVAVKVQRPGIAEVLRRDIEILYFLARRLARHVPEIRRFDPIVLVDEFAEHIADELDFTREARHAERFGTNLGADPAVYVPAVYWDATSRRVLTMARSHGCRLSVDQPQEVEQRTNLAHTLVRLFLVQILEHGFFHADPHPGNVFVLPDGRVCFHDFGIVGRLSAREREHLRELFLAAITRDPQWLADTYLAMGGVSPETDRAAFTRDIGEVLEKYYAASARGASFSAVLQEFIRLGRRYRIHLLRETLLVAKVFMILESVTRMLDPRFDMFLALQRHAPAVMLRDLVGTLDPPAGFAKGYRALTRLRRAADELPEALGGLARQLGEGEARLRLQQEQLSHSPQQIVRAYNRLAAAVIIAGLVIGASIVTVLAVGPHYAGLPVVGLAGYALAAALGVSWFIAARRNGGF